MKILEERMPLVELTGKYAAYLVKHGLNYNAGLTCEDKGPGFENRLQWNNPENIDSGISGIILFLITYYNKSKDAEYLIVIDQYITDLLLYCRKNPTHNYSFYTGRGGVIYILIQRFLIDENENFLKEALDLIIPANREFLNSKYTSDYLYDGRAGTLLIISELYRHTKATFLLDYIDEFLFKILSNLKISGERAFWTSQEEVNLNSSCGFAYGAGGIRYVFHQLNQHTQHPTLKSVIDKIDKFIESCWVKDIENWGDFRKDILDEKMLAHYKGAYLNNEPGLFEATDNCYWANGSIGLLYSSTYIDHEISISVSNKLKDVVIRGNSKSDNLQNGLAGLGMYFLEGNHAFDAELTTQIVNEISDKLLAKPIETVFKNGLLNGDLGGAYFLLMATGYQKGSENILRPFFSPDTKVNFSIKLPELKRNMLARHYLRTISFLETIEPLTFFDYLETPDQYDLTTERQRFENFMANISHLKMDRATEDVLADIFQLENQKTTFFDENKTSSFEVYIKDLLLHESALQDLRQPKEWLLTRTLSISDQIRILDTKWKWDIDNNLVKMKEAHLLNVNLFPGKFEYIILLAGKLEMIEFLLSEDKVILLHQFDQPKKIGEAISTIKYYMETSAGRSIVSDLFEIYGTKEIKDFFDHFDDIVLYKIKEWIYNGILIFKEEN